MRFSARACAICKASASLMTEAVIHQPKETVLETANRFAAFLKDKNAEVEDQGDLGIFAGVRAYPARVKCALLPWQTLKQALDNPEQTATTE